MGWRIVYIEESDYITSYLDNLQVKRENNKINIPFSDIHSLIIDNYKSVLSVQLINKCAANNINVVICGIDHMPHSFIYPVSGQNLAPKILKQQIAWTKDIKDDLHKQIIQGKIENQIQVLVANEKDQFTIDHLTKFQSEVLLGDKTNREGLSAKMYFRSLFGVDFIRFKDDVINHALNYGYSILRSQISKVLISKGLNTSLGLFHRNPENEFNLSDDVIEVFRPIVDHYVYNNISKSEALTREHRINLIKLTTKKMRYRKENHTFLNVINLYVSNILEYINDKTHELLMPKFKDYDI